MSIVDVLRPTSVLKAGAGTAVPSGTLATVTADNSDATYISFDAADYGDNWSLRVGSHTPAAGYGRHRVRGRIRIQCNTGTMFEDIDLGRGTADYIEFATVPITTTFAEKFTPWFQNAEYGLATVGALSDLNIGGGYLSDDDFVGTEGRTAEC